MIAALITTTFPVASVDIAGAHIEWASLWVQKCEKRSSKAVGMCFSVEQGLAGCDCTDCRVKEAGAGDGRKK